MRCDAVRSDRKAECEGNGDEEGAYGLCGLCGEAQQPKRYRRG